MSIRRRARTNTASIAILALVSLAAACSTPTTTTSPSTSPPTLEPTIAPTLAATSSPTGTPQPAPIVGIWTRTITCEEALAAFKAAGFDDQIQAWVVGNFVGETATPAPGHECDDAKAPEPHSHFFTGAGAFGSLDATGKQVDDGSYTLVDGDTLSFPGAGFEYAGDIVVDFKIDGDDLTFTVVFPATCEGSCRVAYGWALSAFDSPTPWVHKH